MIENIIKIGIVDDSRLVRELIKKAVADQPDIMVVGEAEDPYDARHMIKTAKPDVITLDIEMPKMNGIDFLKKIMALHPMPVIMLSTLTAHGAVATIDALEIGAMDYVHKPDLAPGNEDGFLQKLKNELLPKLRAARQAKSKANYFPLDQPNLSQAKEAPKPNKKIQDYAYDLALIGSSTGGMERLRYIIQNLYAPCPPIVIVQHMSPLFTPRMIERLGEIAATDIKVIEAAHGKELKQNHVYISGNHQHVALKSVAGAYRIALEDGPPINGFIASIDHLFLSAASMFQKEQNRASKRFYAFILSGMGHDGAEGMLRLKDAGFITIGENETSCLIYGMPKAAYLKGGVKKEMSIQRISDILSARGAEP